MSINWSVIYNDTATAAQLARYSVVVLDSDSHPALSGLTGGSRQVLGYLSLGEVSTYRSYFSAVEAQGILFDANPDWPDSRFVDLRDSRWTSRVLDDLIPSILDQGFTGLFLDTLDDAGYLEELNPTAYAGMVDAAADLVAAIRARYPTITIMMNRGYELLPQVADHIDYELAECLHTDWNGSTYIRNNNATINEQLAAVRAAMQLNPSLKAVSLDYWNPADADGVARLYALSEAEGLSPYVSTLALDQVYVQPADRAGNTIAAARSLGVISRAKMVSDRVGGADVDYYSFSLTASASLAWTLGTLSANADLAVLSADGQVLASSAVTGVGADAVSATLSAGTYWLKVSGAATAYVLNTTGATAKPLDGDTTLRGGSGTDLLDGGAGNDLMIGGAGNDFYRVNGRGDRVSEGSGQGTDTVLSTVACTLWANVENLTLVGSAAIGGTGNGLDNLLIGNSAANLLLGLGGIDRLAGGNGNDTLAGGAGADRLSGGAGADVFRYVAPSEGGDVITDFQSSQHDKLGFVSANFGHLAAGAISASMFVANSTGIAGRASDRFVFNTTTGVLKYDANGSAGGAYVTIATLNCRALSATDIVILAG
ncbi:MAG TPA: endo alpha-1,4 polygalactosaminidase [Magnetospirillum sp.]|nr:endo alpha-1,4 polygalactosaminidase [Magnetospirillum sp.]